MFALGVATVVGLVSLARDVHDQDGTLPGPRAAVTANYAGVSDDDWTAYGRSWFGDKWSPLTQIMPQNVNKLQVAWHYHTGDLMRASGIAQVVITTRRITSGNELK